MGLPPPLFTQSSLPGKEVLQDSHSESHVLLQLNDLNDLNFHPVLHVSETEETHTKYWSVACDL